MHGKGATIGRDGGVFFYSEERKAIHENCIYHIYRRNY